MPRLTKALTALASGTSARFTGNPPGPYAVGVTTTQITDLRRNDPNTPQRQRKLQTEIWYPADDVPSATPTNIYSDYLGRGAIPGSIAAAEKTSAIGGYRDGLTIAELDRTWPNEAVRDARPRAPDPASRWPLVVFSHGSGAFRASYIYFTEFLASHGFVVMACDHAGSARYTQVDGEVVTPGGARSERAQMEADRPADLLLMIDTMEQMAAGADSRFAGRVDASRCGVTGMSFGGFATAAVLERADPRVKAAILQCPSLAMSGDGKLATSRRANRETPAMMMIGTEDTVIGEAGNEACREYYRGHLGPRALVEIRKGGHVSFTSCELYNSEYGNGIGPSASLTSPGETYTPLPIERQHEIINKYALAFLNTHLRPGEEAGAAGAEYLIHNHFGEDIVYESAP